MIFLQTTKAFLRLSPEMGTNPKHFLLLAYPQYGHIIPLLEFGKSLAQFHNVTFVVPEARIADMKDRHLLGPDLPAKFRYLGLADGLSLHDCYAEGLVAYMYVVFEKVSPAVAELLDSAQTGTNLQKYNCPRVDYVVLDYFHFDAAMVGHEKKVPFYFFDTASAGLTCGVMNITDSSPSYPADCVSFFEKPINGIVPPIDEASKQLLLRMKKAAAFAKGVIYNSCREFDEEFLNAIENHPMMIGQELYFVGPQMGASIDSLNEGVKSAVEKWLDLQRNSSVLYVSYGSTVFPYKEQLFEIGEGLVASGKPFILSLPDFLHCQLPEVLQRNKLLDNPATAIPPFVLVSWVNQKQVLRHPAVAAFLSHCGWNSTLEAIFAGVPVLGWPLLADQKVNALWFKEHGAGDMMDGTGSRHCRGSRLVHAHETAAMIQTAFDNVVNYKNQMEKWRQTLGQATGPDGSSTKDFSRLVKMAGSA